jgi:hypothetical protein
MSTLRSHHRRSIMNSSAASASISPMAMMKNLRWRSRTAILCRACAVDKKRARLNCIDHLLKQFHYQETPKAPIVLPQREHHEHYSRQAVPAEMLVPEAY